MAGNAIRPRAVVFGYADVGVRCTRVLLAHGVEVALVVTHEDNPNETIFFSSLKNLATQYAIPVLSPASANTPEVIAALEAIQPDFIFSFYYRHMIAPQVLAFAKRGALNMHGSYLPYFRGRAPTNWAVLKGATETGATLHDMVEKPDAGAIVHQIKVPIFPDDIAIEVFDKVCVAAELTLHEALPALIAGTAQRTPLIPIPGQYFGARTPEDGRMHPTASGADLHNLVRAVAPPYPGAFFDAGDVRIFIDRTRIARPASTEHAIASAALQREGNQTFITCADGARLHVLALRAMRGKTPVPLSEITFPLFL
jgi:methionyl-tRNA formyltransferase